MNPIQIEYFLIAFLLVTGAIACRGGASLNSQGVDAAMFKGLTSLERAPDSSWIVRWLALDEPGITYAVYRFPEGETPDEEPYALVQGGSYNYRPDNPLSESSMCFVVKIYGADGDKNTNALCTQTTASIFLGLASLERQANGSYLLGWKRIGDDGAAYLVFSRQESESYNFTHPAHVLKTDFLQTEVMPREQRMCYLVRILHELYGDDTNSIEMCTEAEPQIAFDEVENAVTVEEGEVNSGTIVVSWLPSASEDVVGYKVFNNNFSEPLRCEEGNALGLVVGTICTISGLPSGRQISVGVKALDTYGRESTNFRVYPVIVP